VEQPGVVVIQGSLVLGYVETRGSLSPTSEEERNPPLGLKFKREIVKKKKKKGRRNQVKPGLPRHPSTS
jgi:hypothetical protein